MEKFSFSFSGKTMSTSCLALAHLEAATGPSFEAFASSSREIAFGVSAAGKQPRAMAGKRKTSKGASQAEKKMAGDMTQRATAAIDAVRTNERSSKLNRLGAFNESSIPFMMSPEKTTVAIPTASIIVMANTASEQRAIVANLKKRFGLSTLEEGSRRKVLMRAPEDGLSGIMKIQEVINSYPRGFDAISPNFLRVREHRRIDNVSATRSMGAMAATLPWNLQNTGTEGVAGADAKAVGAWNITKGNIVIRVAVLDEGVEVNHPALKAAVVDSKDFSGGKADSSPDGNDAHGTACAGIIASRDATFPGLAPNVSIVGARIARSNPLNPHQWIFDDFKTADAIDWCWDIAKADVLSNSWGGGPPTDAIRLAFERALTLGRAGKGCVVVIAAGNSQSVIPFPATLPNVLVVGASNQWDQRKTKTSKDGEDWWGSCFGPTMGLVAPGVKINTTDISGANGYSNSDFTATFNGTSSATPHVAAAAALVLSVDGSLTEKEVRKILTSTCDAIAGTKDEVGAGRLNTEAALKKAQKALTGPASPRAISKKVTTKKKPTKKKITTKTTTSKSTKKITTKKKTPNKKTPNKKNPATPTKPTTKIASKKSDLAAKTKLPKPPKLKKKAVVKKTKK